MSKELEITFHNTEFAAVIELTGPTLERVGENFELTCVATGYPLNEVTLQWNVETSFRTIVGPNTVFEKVIRNISVVPIRGCYTGTVFRCTASTATMTVQAFHVLDEAECIGK